jgi:hypothetical protein
MRLTRNQRLLLGFVLVWCAAMAIALSGWIHGPSR